MTPKEFCHWLQGYFEINGAKVKISAGEQGLNADQVSVIMKRLSVALNEPLIIKEDQVLKLDELRAVTSMINVEQEQ